VQAIRKSDYSDWKKQTPKGKKCNFSWKNKNGSKFSELLATFVM
jgi:hypothetical protein